MKICRSPINAVADAGASPDSSVLDSIFAKNLRLISRLFKRALSSELADCHNNGIDLAGEMPISLRMLRILATKAFNHSILATARLSAMPNSSVSGKDCVLIELPVMPSFGAMLCQISSVINGISGCNKRKLASKANSNVCRMLLAASASSPARAGLANSKNQSQ